AIAQRARRAAAHRRHADRAARLDAAASGRHRLGQRPRGAAAPGGPRVTMARAASPKLAPATMSEADGVRYLHLGTPWVQGAMRVRKPNELELEYIQRMMAWMLLRPTQQVTRGHAVQLGLGAAAITRYCHGTLRMRTTAVE